jgi:Transglutaminase-like superfamily
VAQSAEGGCVPGTAGLHSERMRQALEPSVRGPIVARMPVGRRLNPAERARLIVEILASYRETRRALRSMQIELAVERLRGGARADADRATDSDVLFYEAWRLGRAVQLTLRLLPGDTRCLTRSLVLTQMLAGRGIPAKLVIGARAKPSFSAHAWVEQAGEPVLPAGEHSFGRLVEL